MKAFSLFVVFVIAKLCVITDRGLSFDALSLAGYFWQDGFIALLFAGFEYAFRRNTRLVAVVYYALIAYAAFNVPIARLTSSPLTLQMIRATGSALSDSITHHLTPLNLALMLFTAAVGIVLPRLLRGQSRLVTRMATPAFLIICVGGAFASTRVVLHGYERNALTALAFSFMPQIESRLSSGDWRESSCAYPDDPDLNHLRSAARGRNVVVIALESTGAQYLQPYGAPSDPMPCLTRLAGEAIIFENAYAVYPESIKGLFSVLCSAYPAFDTRPEDYARAATPSIAQALRRAGYRTALFHSGRFMYLGMRSIVENRGFEVLEDAGHIGGNHNSSFGVDEPSTVERILNWTASLKSDERFFVHYLPIAGHHPYETPHEGPFRGSDERSRYLNALHYSDAAVAQLMRGLKEQGRDTNTLFVIYGDHGEAFGLHHGNFGHTFFLYEENVRVPLMIYAPGLINKPARVCNPASLVDIAPTISDLAGISRQSWQGISLLNPEPRAALFFTDYSLPLIGMRDGPWKFISGPSGGGAELFDLKSDSGEMRNLAVSRPWQAAEYRQNLVTWAGAQKALLSR